MVRLHGPKPSGQLCGSLPPRHRISHWLCTASACLDRFEALFAQPDLLVVELSAVMITGNAGFQRVQALQVSLIACS